LPQVAGLHRAVDNCQAPFGNVALSSKITIETPGSAGTKINNGRVKTPATASAFINSCINLRSIRSFSVETNFRVLLLLTAEGFCHKNVTLL
jgi:hypothetical protein